MVFALQILYLLLLLHSVIIKYARHSQRKKSFYETNHVCLLSILVFDGLSVVLA